MYITIYSFGHIKTTQYKDLIEYYTKLCGKYASIKRIELTNIEGRKIKKSDLNEKIFDDYLVLLSEKGREFNSLDFAMRLKEISIDGSHISFLIGNAFGFEDEILKLPNLVLSLSQMTLSHESAYAILTEQLYRALNINAGGSYHK